MVLPGHGPARRTEHRRPRRQPDRGGLQRRRHPRLPRRRGGRPLLLSDKYAHEMKAALGLDFGTESVRAVLVDLRGRELASAVTKYPHGQIIESLPGSKKKLPPHYALQHPFDWIDSAAKATRAVLRQAKTSADAVLGVGVDFTSCTMLPTKRD